MTVVANAENVRRSVGVVKSAGTRFRTNLFLKDADLEAEIGAGNLLGAESDGGFILINRELHFERLYYAVANPELLGETLALAPVAKGGVLVADVVGPSGEIPEVSEAFESAGFSRHACLRRLQRPDTGDLAVSESDAPIEVARVEDVPGILRVLNENFDMYSDQIPSVARVRAAVEAGTVLLLRGEDGIGGLHYSVRSGLSTVSNFWVVLPAFRNWSMHLFYRYLGDCAGCRRFLAWVHEDNRRSFAVHQWLGYEPDLVVDTIWMKKG